MGSNLLSRFLRRGESLLIRRDGPLTRQLTLAPGPHGLGRLPHGAVPDATAAMTCGFCSTGCSLTVHLREGRAVGLTPTADHPVNAGMACPKGWEALTPLAGPGRATTPLVRRDGHFVRVTWEQATAEMVRRFKAIQAEHGPEAVAWLGTGQMPTEELALLGALGKFGMGMIHGDGNTRQCMATAAVAYKQSFGFDAPPFTYGDFEESDVIVLVGSNMCIAHPIMWERIARSPRKPRVLVIDPRKTETAAAATVHYAVRPKSDLTLLYAVAAWLIDHHRCDERFIREHTTGFYEFASQVRGFTVERAARETGLSMEQVEELAASIGDGRRVSFWWTMGVNQSHQGVRTAQAIIALALMTGNIGRPGTGANSITGQCNAMGSRLFSNTTNLFGGRDFENDLHRQEVADVLGIDVGCIPRVPSLAYDQIVERVLSGKIRALWILGTNPVHSWINQNHLKEVLGRLDCLVVQDMYEDTETARVADILLPAAGWGEKEGTFINSERRIGVIKNVSRAPGQALADFHIFRLVAEAWGCSDVVRRFRAPEAAFQVLKELSRGRPCDISGIRDYRQIEEAGGIQWPLPEGAALQSERRLFEDGTFFTQDGRACFHFGEPLPLPEETSVRFPLLLLTGRGTSAEWHTGTRTRRSAILARLAPKELYVEVSPMDAQSLGIRSEQRVSVRSPRGQVAARAFVTPRIAPGQVFLPMHHESVNRLTFPVFDPHSRQPGYKACAVRIERIGEI